MAGNVDIIDLNAAIAPPVEAGKKFIELNQLQLYQLSELNKKIAELQPKANEIMQQLNSVQVEINTVITTMMFSNNIGKFRVTSMEGNKIYYEES